MIVTMQIARMLNGQSLAESMSANMSWLWCCAGAYRSGVWQQYENHKNGRRLRLMPIGLKQAPQFYCWGIHQLPRHRKPLQFAARQLELEIAKHPLTDSHQSPRPRLFVRRQFRQPPQAIILELALDAVSGKSPFVLMDQAALALAQHVEQVIRVQTMTRHPHRQTPDELRLQPEVDHVCRA